MRYVSSIIVKAFFNFIIIIILFRKIKAIIKAQMIF